MCCRVSLSLSRSRDREPEVSELVGATSVQGQTSLSKTLEAAQSGGGSQLVISKGALVRAREPSPSGQVLLPVDVGCGSQ